MFEAIDSATDSLRLRLWVSVIKARRAVVNDGPVQQVFLQYTLAEDIERAQQRRIQLPYTITTKEVSIAGLADDVKLPLAFHTMQFSRHLNILRRQLNLPTTGWVKRSLKFEPLSLKELRVIGMAETAPWPGGWGRATGARHAQAE